MDWNQIAQSMSRGYLAGYDPRGFAAMEDSEARRAAAAEEAAWQRTMRERQKADWNREDAAVAGLANVQAGVSKDEQGRVAGTYGMTPQQIAAAGGATGLRTKLASYDAPDSYDLQDASAPKPAMNAAGLKVAAAKKSDVYGAMGEVALARRDMTGFGNMYAQRENALDDEVMSAARPPKPGTPEWEAWQQKLGERYKGHKQVTLGQPDKNGIRQMSYEAMDGTTVFSKMSPAEQEIMARAEALMERNPTKAIQLMATVDQNLAAAIARDNDITMKGLTAGNDAAYRSTGLNDQRKHHADQIALGYDKLRSEERQRASDRAANHPTLDPESQQQLLDIQGKIATAQDPRERARLERQYQMVVTRAALKMGKVAPLPSNAPKPDIPMTELMPFIEDLRRQPEHKKKTLAELRNIAMETLQGGGGDDLASLWTSPQAAAAKPVPAKPASAGLPAPSRSAQEVRGGSPIETINTRGGTYYRWNGQPYPSEAAAREARGF